MTKKIGLVESEDEDPSAFLSMTRPSHVNKVLVFLLLALVAFNLSQTSISTDVYMDSEFSPSVYGFEEHSDEEEDEDEADRIIRRSFDSSYAHILPCAEEEEGKNCMKKTVEFFNQPDLSNNTDVPAIPWWFQTLLRDVMTNGAYGFWHHFYTTKPAFHFCTIGKVATTEWRKVFCELNKEDCIEPNTCGKRNCAWRTKQTMPEKAPYAVFLRDPLERLLSGFLDKCANGKKYPQLTEDIDDKDKQWFAAYVDVLPLRWNVHFVPQAIACDLYRKLDTYDFVGKMGTDFMFELDRMATQFGGQLPEVLNKSFAYKEHVKAGKVNTGSSNRHATHAPAKVQKYFTPAAVRRGLELLSIDYVMLGLDVPDWARQMLKDDK
ncbi:hypothetical protein THAOC_03599 [Thalassiosira oceanica]|uniref:Sulfotransferase domain-containing protein n=1 Tax=Thalassiosira oceanica TaxID=159749 RepID=K0TKR7_THAOC|nr:hypothetical protein THAOC_03599 [Thalassiosira oceanica]|eukprot:EJK74711.1 hypothetical protein THAOC_03599 [Thalassiosira oceanica]